jgi:hypothetical protein
VALLHARQKGRLLQAHSNLSATKRDAQLMGAEITFGSASIGHVEGLVHDPISHRVRRLITSYGSTRRRVGVPIDWVVKRSPSRLELAVGVRSLNNLGDLVSP